MDSKQDCLKFLRELIDTTIATVDKDGNPQSRVIDVMLEDGETVYFLTARGKRFYKQLQENNHIALVGLKDNKTVRIIGEVKQLEDQHKWIDKMFEKNKYMNNVYPGDARYILEPFKVECGEMEFFDLTQKPIYRKTFKINTEESTYFNKKYVITDNWIECDVCKATCPQNAIEEGSPYHIMPNHCLDCGTCYENCPVNAIEDPY